MRWAIRVLRPARPHGAGARRCGVGADRRPHHTVVRVPPPDRGGRVQARGLLKAEVQNPSKLTLLEGPVNLKLDGTSKRRATLPRCPSGDRFNLRLRVDAAIEAACSKPETKRGSQGPGGENFAASSISKKEEDIDLEGRKEDEELSSGPVSSGGGSDEATL